VDLDAAVRDLAPKLLGYCFLETGDAGLAEEISQDTLTALVQRWRRHGPPDSPAAFVFAIARRRSARAVVRRRLWRPLEEVFGLRDGRPDPEQAVVQSDERARVALALTRLKPTDRQVLLLLTVWELGMEETARSLGISLSAAKMRAMRARHRLGEHLRLGGAAPNDESVLQKRPPAGASPTRGEPHGQE
jgi:RNA polymerase sigma factor (sigma-70 family)